VDFCDELVVLSHDGVAGAASDVDAVTGFGGVGEDTLVASWRRLSRATRTRPWPAVPRLRGQGDVRLRGPNTAFSKLC
jgi:hypothetical protein